MMLLTDRMTHDSALLTKADLLLMDYLLIADWWLDCLLMTYQLAYQLVSHQQIHNFLLGF